MFSMNLVPNLHHLIREGVVEIYGWSPMKYEWCCMVTYTAAARSKYWNQHRVNTEAFCQLCCLPCFLYICKVHIFWEGHKILRNLHRRFNCYYLGQIYGGGFAKICHLLRLYELYHRLWCRVAKFFDIGESTVFFSFIF